jgi:hypothetical protein
MIKLVGRLLIFKFSLGPILNCQKMTVEFRSSINLIDWIASTLTSFKHGKILNFKKEKNKKWNLR